MACVGYLVGTIRPHNDAQQGRGYSIAGLRTRTRQYWWPNNGTPPETGTLVIRVRVETVHGKELASEALILEGSQHDCGVSP
jgi:hypothetical protein